jgi:hypothetical protein
MLAIYIADTLFFYTNFVVRIQNSGAVATWTKSWWRCRICNKNHSVSFTFPILFCDENTKVGTIAMPFAQKVKVAQMTLFTVAVQVFLDFNASLTSLDQCMVRVDD